MLCGVDGNEGCTGAVDSMRGRKRGEGRDCVACGSIESLPSLLFWCGDVSFQASQL